MPALLGELAPIASTSSKLGYPLLTFLVFLPAMGALVAMIVPAGRPELTRAVGYVTSMATFGMALFLLTQFDTNPLKSGYQLLEDHSWIGALGVRWTLGVDGISLFMVALSALLFPIALLASAHISRPKSFTIWMLLLESAMIGVFLALDAVVFFIFFEFVLVPMYFLIAGWGHDNRRYAAMKFFLFTMAGSAFLFAGILSVAFMRQHSTHVLTFDVRTLTDWAAAHIHGGTAKALFLAFAAERPDPGLPSRGRAGAEVTTVDEAKTSHPSKAGAMLKIGAYGFLRFAIPFFPQAAVDLAPLLLVLAVVGITYGAIVAAMQPNLKRIIAYSSVAHLGFVVLGVFALTNQGISGGLFTMLSHGLTTGALFLLVGMLYDRRHTYELRDFRGIWKAAPVFGGLFVAATFASIGLPGFSGFVGEFLSLLGAFLTSRWYVVVASTGVILADIGGREIVTVLPLLGLSLFLGFYPKPVLDRLQPSVEALIHHVEQNSNYKAPTVPTSGPVAAPAQGTGK